MGPKKKRTLQITSDSEDSDSEEDDIQFGNEDESEDDGGSQSSEVEPEVDSDEDDEVVVAPKKKKRMAVAADDLESESEAESDVSEEEDEGLTELQKEMAQYDPETMYGDRADQDRLQAMTEVERETELYERFEKYDEMKSKMELMEKRRQLKRDQRQKSKPTSTRKRSKATTPVVQTKMKNRSRFDEAFGLEPADSEDEDAVQRPSKRRQVDPDAWRIPGSERPSLEDMQSVQVTRNHVQKWVNEIYFEETVKGLFIRMSLGPDKETHKVLYTIAEIVDIKEGESYEVGSEMTNKWAELRFNGEKVKLYELKYISNKPYTEDEFRKWMHHMDKKKINPPTKTYLEERKAFEERVSNFVYTDEEINTVVARRNKMTGAKMTLSTRRKIELKSKAEACKDKGDIEGYEKCQDALDELEQLEQDAMHRSKQMDFGIAKINSNNKKMNKDYLEDDKKKKASKDGVDFDPFTRRPTRSSFSLPAQKNTPETAAAEAKTPVAKQSPKSDGVSPILIAADRRGRMLQAARDLKTHTTDFDLDIDFDSSPLSTQKPINAPPKFKLEKKSAGEGGGPKKLSLDEYFSRRT